MGISYEGALARVEGAASVEDALDFAGWLAATEIPRVDLSAATAIHAAVLQCLLAARPQLLSPPGEFFWAACLSDLPLTHSPRDTCA